MIGRPLEPTDEETRAQASGTPLRLTPIRSLADGIILCNLVNAHTPNTIAKIWDSQLPFKKMENLKSFLRGCRDIGVPPTCLFEVSDLLRANDLDAVVLTLKALKEMSAPGS